MFQVEFVLTRSSQASTSPATPSRTRPKPRVSPRWRYEQATACMVYQITLSGTSILKRSRVMHEEEEARTWKCQGQAVNERYRILGTFREGVRARGMGHKGKRLLSITIFIWNLWSSPSLLHPSRSVSCATVFVFAVDIGP